MNGNGRSIVERLVVAAAGVLLAAALLTMAVNLLRRIWVDLALITGLVLLCVLGFQLIRSRRRSW